MLSFFLSMWFQTVNSPSKVIRFITKSQFPHTVSQVAMCAKNVAAAQRVSRGFYELFILVSCLFLERHIVTITFMKFLKYCSWQLFLLLHNKEMKGTERSGRLLLKTDKLGKESKWETAIEGVPVGVPVSSKESQWETAIEKGWIGKGVLSTAILKFISTWSSFH